MSYEPSHRKPPRQQRWPDATPGEGWPAYRQPDGGRSWASAGVLAARYAEPASEYWSAGNGYGSSTTAWPAAGEGYTHGFDGAADGYAAGYPPPARDYGYAQDYGQAAQYGQAGSEWDGYTEPGHEFGTSGYLEQDEFSALDATASWVLVAPDTVGEWWRQPKPDEVPGQRGPIVGMVMGILAAAVAIGVATFAAAFVRPQSAPASAVGGAFIDRIPAMLKSHLVAHFGAHSQTVLLLGTAALIAIVLGLMARRNVSTGVAGIAAFGLLGAFIAVTRPASQASDVIPSAIGGLAGIMALLGLARASVPLRPVYSGAGQNTAGRGGAGPAASRRGGAGRRAR
jgi:hypothetical protein